MAKATTVFFSKLERPKPVSAPFVITREQERIAATERKRLARIRAMGEKGYALWLERKDEKKRKDAEARSAKRKMSKWTKRDNARRRKKSKRNKRSPKKTAYQVYLDSPHWKVTRARIRAVRKVCEACGIAFGLHVHHGTYARKGCELDSDLFLLCGNCHKGAHAMNGGRIDLRLYQATLDFIMERKTQNPIYFPNIS